MGSEMCIRDSSAPVLIHASAAGSAKDISRPDYGYVPFEVADATAFVGSNSNGSYRDIVQKSLIDGTYTLVNTTSAGVASNRDATKPSTALTANVSPSSAQRRT